MDIAPTTLSLNLAPSSPTASQSDSTGFSVELQAASSPGASPPGASPPGSSYPPAETQQVGEVAKPEPNAPSQEPDSPPAQKTQSKADGRSSDNDAGGANRKDVSDSGKKAVADAAAVQALVLAQSSSFFVQTPPQPSASPTVGTSANTISNATSAASTAAAAQVAPDAAASLKEQVAAFAAALSDQPQTLPVTKSPQSTTTVVATTEAPSNAAVPTQSLPPAPTTTGVASQAATKASSNTVGTTDARTSVPTVVATQAQPLTNPVPQQAVKDSPKQTDSTVAPANPQPPVADASNPVSQQVLSTPVTPDSLSSAEQAAQNGLTISPISPIAQPANSPAPIDSAKDAQPSTSKPTPAVPPVENSQPVVQAPKVETPAGTNAQNGSQAVASSSQSAAPVSVSSLVEQNSQNPAPARNAKGSDTSAAERYAAARNKDSVAPVSNPTPQQVVSSAPVAETVVPTAQAPQSAKSSAPATAVQSNSNQTEASSVQTVTPAAPADQTNSDSSGDKNSDSQNAGTRSFADAIAGDSGPAHAATPAASPTPNTSSVVGASSQPATVNRASAAAAPAQTATIDRTQLMRQVADRIELLSATQPKDGVVVHLQPPDLGSITMVVKSSGGNVDTQIFASHSGVRDALQDSRPALTQAMQDRGINLTSVTISSQDASSKMNASVDSRQGRQTPTQQQQQQQSQTSTRSPRESGVSAATIDSARQRIRSATGVDLWI